MSFSIIPLFLLISVSSIQWLLTVSQDNLKGGQCMGSFSINGCDLLPRLCETHGVLMFLHVVSILTDRPFCLPFSPLYPPHPPIILACLLVITCVYHESRFPPFYCSPGPLHPTPPPHQNLLPPISPLPPPLSPPLPPPV